MRLHRSVLVLLTALISVGSLSCGSNGEATPASAARNSEAPHAAPAPPTAAEDQTRSQAVIPEPRKPLEFVPAEGWVEEKPSVVIRKAQYRLPKAEGDAEDAQLVVFYFGLSAGTLDANIERWCGQFEQTDGSRSIDHLKRSQRKVGGMRVHELELSGTYVAETTPGSGERFNKPGYALMLAVLETDHGPYFVKLVGPAATVEQRSGEFRDFVSRSAGTGSGAP